ncbi:MAG: phosphate ABC transporter substrate-binding protein [Luteolibacter sp.]
MTSRVVAIALAISSMASSETIRVNGSTTVNPVVSEAAEILRKEKGMNIQVDTQGGSSGGITALGEGRIDLAMSSRPLNESDRKKYPDVKFTPFRIGEDAVAMIVSRDVWNGGTKALTKEQMQSIYERKTTNWKQLGGIDRRIAFFNKEPGRGTWEVFVKWLYGKPDKAPRVAHPEVGANEEARSKVAGSRGALSQLSASWVDNKTIFALGVKIDDTTTIRPEAQNIVNGTYPLSRPLYVITNGEPSGGTKVLIDFLHSEQGQNLVTKHGYLTLEQLVFAELEH